MEYAQQTTPFPGQDHLPTVVATVLERHLSGFLEQVDEEAETSLPRFVREALKSTTTCGDFTRGFLRLRCDSCKTDRILPFRCKTAICPTCAGRKMADRAAWLVDRVLRNDIGWRQIVVTFPSPLAVALCYRPELAGKITRLCARAISEFQRGRAPDAAERGIPRSAAVVFPQRFADGLTSWWHLHLVLPDGVFREQKYTLACPFEPQPVPEPAELRTLLETIVRRVTAL